MSCKIPLYGVSFIRPDATLCSSVVANGKRNLVGEQGMSQEHGPPPYRKPHDLKKAWKVSVLASVIKHVPRFE